MASELKIALVGDPKVKERVSAEAMTPGMLVEFTTADTIRKHATAGGACAPMFLLENDIGGKGIATACESGEMIRAGVFQSGDEVNALLANGETAVIGSWLESNGDGYLRVVDTDASVGDIKPGSNRFQALEAVDMSGSSGADPSARIAVLVA